jgi:hypothetical protein
MKEDNRKPKKAVPSKIEKVLELQTLCREELFCEDASKTSEKSRKRWKKYSAKLSIYRGEGGSVKKLPRYDRCEKSGGRVSTPTFRHRIGVGVCAFSGRSCRRRGVCGDFVNLWGFVGTIFEDAPRGRVRVRVFIGMSVRALWVSMMYYVIRKKSLSLSSTILAIQTRQKPVIFHRSLLPSTSQS